MFVLWSVGSFATTRAVVRVGFMLVRRTGDLIFSDHYITMTPI